MSSLHIGDIVAIEVAKENREWGYNPAPDGTLATIVGFDRITYTEEQAKACGVKPGIHYNRCWARLKVGDTLLKDSVNHCHLRVVTPATDPSPVNDYIGPALTREIREACSDIIYEFDRWLALQVLNRKLSWSELPHLNDAFREYFADTRTFK